MRETPGGWGSVIIIITLMNIVTASAWTTFLSYLQCLKEQVVITQHDVMQDLTHDYDTQ